MDPRVPMTEWVWVIDPDERRALCYSPRDPGGVLVEELRTQNPGISIPLAELLTVLDSRHER